jgi:hypothetical protein
MLSSDQAVLVVRYSGEQREASSPDIAIEQNTIEVINNEITPPENRGERRVIDRLVTVGRPVKSDIRVRATVLGFSATVVVPVKEIEKSTIAPIARVASFYQFSTLDESKIQCVTPKSEMQFDVSTIDYSIKYTEFGTFNFVEKSPNRICLQMATWAPVRMSDTARQGNHAVPPGRCAGGDRLIHPLIF